MTGLLHDQHHNLRANNLITELLFLKELQTLNRGSAASPTMTSSGRTQPGPQPGPPGSEQPADQITFVYIDSQTNLCFGNHFQRTVALADSPFNPGAFNIRNGGKRPHLTPREVVVCHPGIRDTQKRAFSVALNRLVQVYRAIV
jgi:hypothetical protein